MSDKAAIYLADPSLLGSKLLDQLEGLLSYEGLGDLGSASGLRLNLAAGKVTMNFMPQELLPEHLEGFCGYAKHVVKDKQRLPYIITRIGNIRLVLGCVIDPGFDKAGTIQEFLFVFNAAVNGLLFLENTIFDHDGEPLGGPLME